MISINCRSVFLVLVFKLKTDLWDKQPQAIDDPSV